MACLIGIVVFIAVTVMMKESLRLDEAQSIWQTSHSLQGTLEVVAQDVHMPMYHILLHYWMVFFGTSVEAVRSMSLLFLIACIPALYLLARTILNRGWALVVITVFALSPFMNWYASEARMYTLLTLFAILSQYFFVRILQGKQGWGGYALTAILGAYSHYFFMFTLAAQAIFYLFNRKQFKPGSLKRFILTAGGVVVGIAPWIYYFISQGAASNTRPQLPTPST
ncbi:MAG TPA: glycosyltransferase family 39 protein, partial [Candidatus Saccharimonadales bacterium]